MILHYRMTSDEVDNFLRDYQFPIDSTLGEVCEFIVKDLGYSPATVYSFFTADEKWQRLDEYTSEKMDDITGWMEDVTLQETVLQGIERLILTFDMFNDRSYFLELRDHSEEDEEMIYPRLAFAHGEAPDQFDGDAVGDGPSIFEEAMGGFMDFDGDESMDDEY